MEKLYQQKIEYLQKFIPFLSKLIERLKNELDSEAKVVQLQLFYNLLICPDPSVTIEDLTKCEEALINFYKSYHCDSDEPVFVEGGEEELSNSSNVGTYENVKDTSETKPNIECSIEDPNKIGINSESDKISNNLKETNQHINEQNCKENNENYKEDKNNLEENEIKNKEDSCEEKNDNSLQEKNKIFEEILQADEIKNEENGRSDIESKLSNSEMKGTTKDTNKHKEGGTEENVNDMVNENSQNNAGTHMEEKLKNDNKKTDAEGSSKVDEIEIKNKDISSMENNGSDCQAEQNNKDKHKEGDTEEKVKSPTTTLNDMVNENSHNIGANMEENLKNENKKTDTKGSSQVDKIEVKNDDISSIENYGSNSQEEENNKKDKNDGSDKEIKNSISERNEVNQYEIESKEEESDHEEKVVKINISENKGDESKNNDFDLSDNADDEEIEENVELVKMPEAETEEMILPDLEEEELQTSLENETQVSNVTAPDGLEKKVDEDVEHTDEVPIVIVNKSVGEEKRSNDVDEIEPTAEEDEPLLIAMATDTSEKINEDEADDPLDVDASISKSQHKEVCEVSHINTKDDDDDDDDVQLIETRNSPICIDSDDDVPPITKPQIGIRKGERNISFPRETSTQKSRDSLQARPSQPVIDLIELLDSSDDDERTTIKKPLPRTPMKRCLLPKPIRSNEQMPKNTPNQPDKFISYTPPKPPTQVHISTPQSQFLNAVNLQPANTSNPPAFSTQLCNKNIIIPNAFYGNPPRARGVEKDKSLRKSQQLRNLPDSKSGAAFKAKHSRHKAWLENFMINFASPLHKASNSCFVILQRVLKYNIFQKIKDVRMNLDAVARKSTNANPSLKLDVQLMQELRRIFFSVDSTQLSEVGFRFCEFATNQMFGKPIPLTTDIRTGRVSSQTRGENDVSEEPVKTTNFLNGFLNATPPNMQSGTDSSRKKQKDADDEQDEYTPNIPINEEELIGERKRSLRTNRVKRVDNSFSYNEDQEDTEDEDDDSYAAVKRKVEQKRQEAKKQREQMAKSFESAFIETFSKNMAEPAHAPVPMTAPVRYANGSDPKKRRLSQSSSFASPSAHIDLSFNEDSLDEGLKQHRIYKVVPKELISAKSLTSKAQKQRIMRYRPSPQIIEPEIITCSDDGSDNDNDNDDDKILITEHTRPKRTAKLTSKRTRDSVPKNTNPSMHVMKKGNDKCILCDGVFQRIVHHYVNEHKGSEVYTSRLSKAQVTKLRQNSGNKGQQYLYKNGQNQYEGTCAFCQKRSRFMLGYWYQHYTMHTGEYAYRCTGCGTRKPTRSMLQVHINASCKKDGTLKQDYKFAATQTTQIDAHICSLCNYIQLQRKNIVTHLHKQHNIKEILPKHILKVVLLNCNQGPGVVSTKTTVKDSAGAIYEIQELDADSGSGSFMDYNAIQRDGFVDDIGNTIGSNETNCEYYGQNSTAEFNYDVGDPSDDLSFMICGMLDVQMDTE